MNIFSDLNVQITGTHCGPKLARGLAVVPHCSMLCNDSFTKRYMAFKSLQSCFRILTSRACLFTDQMAEWYRASASGSVDLGFDSESGQTNDFKIGIHSFPA